jgi:hypothetical protein
MWVGYPFYGPARFLKVAINQLSVATRRTSATQQDKLTEAERSSIWKPTSLIRGVAFATPLFAKQMPPDGVKKCPSHLA